MVIHIKLMSAILFYSVYLAGLVLFAVTPLLRGGGWLIAIGFGLLLMRIAYSSDSWCSDRWLGMAAFRECVITLTFADIIGGVCVCAISIAAGLYSFAIFTGN